MDAKSLIEAALTSIKVPDPLVEKPRDLAMGDFAFPVFTYAKFLNKNPHEIAVEVAKKISIQGMTVEALGPYVNFKINTSVLAKEIIPPLLSSVKKVTMGYHGEEVLVEYFQGNTHKGVHIGHIRNISLGESLCRVLERAGFSPRRVNFQGDIGPHVAKCLWGLKHTAEKPPSEHRGMWLGKMYTMASQRAKESKEIAEDIKGITMQLYQENSAWTEIWKETRQWCLDDFEVLYKEFGVKFDRLYFESQTERLGKEIVKKMLKDGIAKESDGAIVIDLSEINLGVYVLLTTEGYALYSAKDIGLAYLKLKEFPNMSRSVNVVGSEQNLHFQQLYKTLELMGYPIADKLYHLSYGLVMLPEGKMSSRDGTLVLYHDLLEHLLNKTQEEVKKRHQSWGEHKRTGIAKSLALSALKFWMINREPQKNVIFDWDAATDLEGETGPYIQYACVRASSVLRQSRYDPVTYVHTYDFNHPKERKLLQSLYQYAEVIEEAATKYRPHLVSGYLITLAQTFSEFYHECPIIKSDDNLKHARLALTKSVRNVLADGLTLLGIDVLEEM